MNKVLTKVLNKAWLGCGILSFSMGSLAMDVVGDFDEAIRRAVMDNPGVRAAYHNFEASQFSVRTAKGGYLPSVDLSAEGGETNKETPVFPEDNFDHHNFRLTVSQMLFDGFKTSKSVDQADNAERAAYFQLMAASEEAALEAATAYLDVMRYQALVELAESNLKEHQRIYSHVQERTDAGVSRGVDLEQANARLALADFNLLQEVTNLHDVRARFLRVVTALPAEKLNAPSLPLDKIPATRDEALKEAFDLSPVLQRAVANLDTSHAAAQLRRSPFMPEVYLRLRAEDGNNLEGIAGDHTEEAIELVMEYNLYNGGSDKSAYREALRKQAEAFDLRVKACHDVRQTLTIAHNDIGSIERRLIYLATNEASIAKARVAYRNQFDIGQRTLLDLLDSENEYFDVSRSLVNARFDQSIARVRTLAAIGILKESMDVAIEVPNGHENRVAVECPLESGSGIAEYMERRDRLLNELREGGKDSYRMEVRFEFDSANLLSMYFADIESVAKYMQENPTLKALIVGHTDSKGSDSYNVRLSNRRAAAVVNYMVAKYGIDKSRLKSEGRGESEPVADNGTDQGRALNRRVEFVPLEK